MGVINEVASDPASYNIYEKEGKYYIPASSIQSYCEATGNFDVKEALDTFQETNNISNATVVYDYCDEAFVEFFEEAGIVLEKAAEDDAMSLKQAMEWYDKFVAVSKTKLESKELIEERIKVLEICVKNMEHAKKNEHGERFKYALKELIPFNNIYRLFKKDDVYAGMTSILRNLGRITVNVFKVNSALNSALAGVSVGIRYSTFEKMLDNRIAQTKEAIAYLKGKLKDLK